MEFNRFCLTDPFAADGNRPVHPNPRRNMHETWGDMGALAAADVLHRGIGQGPFGLANGLHSLHSCTSFGFLVHSSAWEQFGCLGGDLT